MATTTTTQDGESLTRITLTLTERQIIFNRTGLTPPRKMWVPTAELARERQIAVYGTPGESTIRTQEAR